MRLNKLIFTLFLLLFSNKFFSSVETKSRVKFCPNGKQYTFNDQFSFILSGHAALEAFYDSHQVLGFQQDQYVGFPLPKESDPRGLDISDKDQLNMLGFRVVGSIGMIGPKVFSADTSAQILCEFDGVDNSTVRLLRIRKGFFDLDWERTNLLLGYYYHPIYIDEVYPDTVSRGFGRGYDPFAYAPQIRLCHKVEKFEYVFAVSTLFRSKPSRSAVVPDLFFKVNLELQKHLVGAGINLHAEVPRLETDFGYKTSQQVIAIQPFVFALFDLAPFEAKFRASLVENGTDFDIMGGYATRFRNPQTDERTLTSLRALTFWSDIVYNGKRVEPALFVGVSKNLGASKKIIKSYEDGEGNDIPLFGPDIGLQSANYMFILAPRIRVHVKNFVFGFELEYSRALFARDFDQENWQDDFDDFGKVIHGDTASNTRFLFVTFYGF